MAEQTPNTTPPMADEEPFIPAYYLLVIALIGFLVAFVVLFTQPTFSVVGWGGLGIGLLSLVAWVLMAPEQARATLTGRTVRFGGTSLLVTLIVLVALIALYTVVRGADLQVDLTQRDTFSLTEESREAITGIGADPNFGTVNIIAFYGAAQAASRDRDELLFADYQRTSAGKITYQFVDPDRNPILAQQYEVTRPGQIVVVAQNPDGTPNVENAEVVDFFSQDELTNAILRVSASGDFRAYFLNLDDGLQINDFGATGMSNLSEILTNQLGWESNMVRMVDLLAPESDVNLNDPSADGIVLVIPGGSDALPDEAVALLANYLDQGGQLVIYAGLNLQGEPSLATAENLSTMLFEKFGLRFSNDVVLDAVQAFQVAVNPAANDFDSSHYITQGLTPNNFMIFNLPHPVEIAPTLPETVTVSELVSSSGDSYSKSSILPLLESNENIARTDDDPQGPFVLAAAATDTQTGAQVVLVGSTLPLTNETAQLSNAGVVNLNVALNSLFWMTDFESFFTQVTIQSAQRPEDTPIVVNQQNLNFINLLTVFLLPFGILAIGVVVWWNNRETAR